MVILWLSISHLFHIAPIHYVIFVQRTKKKKKEGRKKFYNLCKYEQQTSQVWAKATSFSHSLERQNEMFTKTRVAAKRNLKRLKDVPLFYTRWRPGLKLESVYLPRYMWRREILLRDLLMWNLEGIQTWQCCTLKCIFHVFYYKITTLPWSKVNFCHFFWLNTVGTSISVKNSMIQREKYALTFPWLFLSGTHLSITWDDDNDK